MPLPGQQWSLPLAPICNYKAIFHFGKGPSIRKSYSIYVRSFWRATKTNTRAIERERERDNGLRCCAVILCLLFIAQHYFELDCGWPKSNPVVIQTSVKLQQTFLSVVVNLFQRDSRTSFRLNSCWHFCFIISNIRKPLATIRAHFHKARAYHQTCIPDSKVNL